MFSHRFLCQLAGSCLLALVAQSPVSAQLATSKGNAPQSASAERMYLYNLYLTLHSNPALRREVELSREQQEELKKISAELRERQMQLSTQYREDAKAGDTQAALQAYREATQAMREELLKNCDRVLLRHQTERIAQINRQQIRRYRRANGVYSYSEGTLDLPLRFADHLELSPADIQELEETIAEAREKMDEEIRRAKEEAYKKVFKSLSLRQRKMLLDHVGEPFDFDSSSKEQRRESQRQWEERRKQQAAPQP